MAEEDDFEGEFEDGGNVNKLSLDDDDDVVADLEEKLENDPKNDALIAQLAQAYLESGQEEDAQVAIGKAVKLNPNSAGHLFLQGKIYLANDEAAKAEASFQNAITKDPNHAQSLVELATIKMNRHDAKNDEEALGLFKRAVAADPSNITAHQHAGQILLSRGKAADSKEAASFFQKAVALDPHDGAVHAKLIQAYDAAGDDAARNTARTAIHNAFKSGQLNEAFAAFGRYNCGQFEAGNKFIMAFDHFKPVEPENAVYSFSVYKKGEVHEDKELARFVLNTKHQLTSKGAVQETFGSEPTFTALKAKVSELAQKL